MKRDHLITIALTILVIASLGLSYFLMFDTQSLNQFFNQDASTEVVIQDNSNRPTVNTVYQPTSLEFEDVLRPTSYVFRNNDQFYLVSDASIRQQLEELITSEPVKPRSLTQTQDKESYKQLFQENYLEINFPTLIPIGTLANFIELDDPYSSSFSLDQILIPLNRTGHIYFADSKSGTYVRANLPRGLSVSDIENVLFDQQDKLIEMERYIGKAHFLYLPVNKVPMRSHLYTLQVLPESLFIADIFENNPDYNSQEAPNGNTIYKDFQYTVEFNQQTKRFDFSINQVGQADPVSDTERLLNSFNPVKNYSYWRGDLRLNNYHAGTVTYRRYLNNLPIYVAPGLADYGSTTVHLRNDYSGVVYRYQSSLLIFHADIYDLYQNYELESSEEILNIFNQYGYRVADFDDIHIGYEWQADMENYRKAILVPKWYFIYQGRPYSIEQIATDRFYQIWHDSQEPETEEGV